MYAASSPSDRADRPAEIVPLRRWADGAAEIHVGLSDGETRLRHLYQSDPCRVLFPRAPAGAPKESVIVTTSGGIVGGDRLRFELQAGVDCAASFTTQAAEKIYGSAGADAEIAVSLRVGSGARTEWVPQETILFDNSRLRRTTRVDLDADARLVAGEFVVFGRRARGEAFTSGFLHDGWRVSRDGALVWVDALHLDGDIAAAFADPHAFDGAAGAGFLMAATPDLADLPKRIRDYIAGLGPGCAATVLDGLLIVRFVNADAAILRRQFAQCWSALRQAALQFPAALPRVWEV